MYTIGQVSEMFNIPISTLRYYDKEGFFPNLKRVSGIRKFNKNGGNSLLFFNELRRAEQRLRKLEKAQNSDKIKITLIFRNGKIKEITVNSKGE